MNIGETIRNFRLQRSMSQGDIEKRTGLLRCYLSRVENGHTIPSLDTLARLPERWIWRCRNSFPKATETAIRGCHSSPTTKSAF